MKPNDQASKPKRVHVIRIVHRDEVEPPFTDWLKEAYDLPDALAAEPRTKGVGSKRPAASGRKPARRSTR